jgi:hypothetical protein
VLQIDVNYNWTETNEVSVLLPYEIRAATGRRRKISHFESKKEQAQR